MGKQPQRTHAETRREKPPADKVKTATGEVLRRYRTAKNLTQQELGIVSDVGSVFISQIETGSSSPTILTLFKLAHALGVPPSTILQEIEERLQAIKTAPR